MSDVIHFNWQVIAFVFIHPVWEEILFRGILQKNLYQTSWGSKRLLGISLANVVSSIIFGAMHFFFHPPFWALAVLLPSLVLGFIWDRYRKLYLCIGVHSLFNTGYLLLFGL